MRRSRYRRRGRGGVGGTLTLTISGAAGLLSQVFIGLWLALDDRQRGDSAILSPLCRRLNVVPRPGPLNFPCSGGLSIDMDMDMDLKTLFAHANALLRRLPPSRKGARAFRLLHASAPLPCTQVYMRPSRNAHTICDAYACWRLKAVSSGTPAANYSAPMARYYKQHISVMLRNRPLLGYRWRRSGTRAIQQ